MTTLTDVAAAAGVSTATVSHVLNGTRYVSPETLERVRAAIEATRYRPNPYARALRTATTESIGFVSSDISNPFSTAIMRGIAASLRDAHYTMLVADAHEDPTSEREAVEALVQRRADGLIVALTAQTTEQSVTSIAELGVPVVLVDRSVSLPLDQVLVESLESVQGLVGDLLDLGHRRVALVAGRMNHSTTVERIAGWRAAHERRGLPVDPNLQVTESVDAETAEALVSTLMATPEPPTAIFATSNQVSLGALRAIRRTRKTIPRDISFAAFDDIEWSDLLDAPITCLAQPTFDIGAKAVESLMRRIADPEAAPSITRLSPRLIRRASLAPPPG